MVVILNNPPAFPHVADILQFDGNSATVKTLTQNGMTLRDYMAAQAMQGMIAGFLADSMDIQWEVIAENAYWQADAMLKARDA
jgi:hypothetical protein